MTGVVSPVGIHEEEGVSAAEEDRIARRPVNLTTTLIKFQAVCTACAVVNALSDKLQLTIRREGHVHEQFYRLGEPQAPLAVIGESDKTGTTEGFWPSPSIFSDTEFQYEVLSKRLRELSFLNSGVSILFN